MIRTRDQQDMIKQTRRKPGDKMGAALQALLDDTPKPEPSLFEQVAAHMQLIDKLVARGHSYATIAQALGGAGVPIKENTLRIYAGRLRRERTTKSPGKPVKRRPNQPVRDRFEAASAPLGRATPTRHAGALKATTEVPSWMTDEPDEDDI